MSYELIPEYDSRQSFYGKARIEMDMEGVVSLYSYNTLVCYIKNKNVVLCDAWDYSATTLRHVKEFLRQHGFKADSKAQIQKDYKRD